MLDGKYYIKGKLGSGGSSDVYYVVDEEGSKFSAKIIRNANNNPDALHISTMQKEYLIMEMLSMHPNILKCVESIGDGELQYSYYKFTISYNITEYAGNGVLSSYLNRTGCFDEAVARFYIRQLASAIEFMHEGKVAHMDIKPHNIVFDESFNLKVMDFGCAEYLNGSSSKINTRCGTEGFMAPEVADLNLRSEFDPFKADVYSLGVTMHLILFGRRPDLGGCEASSTLDSNASENSSGKPFRNDQECWGKESYEVANLIRQMLSSNPDDRPSVSEVLSHNWFNDSSLNISEEDVFKEMSLRKDVAFPPPVKFNFE